MIKTKCDQDKAKKKKEEQVKIIEHNIEHHIK